jgi:serine/threonine protein kinase
MTGDPELTVGQKIGHYEILSELGRGGMGEVYLAQDAKLSRKVALKVLPGAFTQDPERLRRFEQEARATSALNHPNILTIFEIGEAEGRHYTRRSDDQGSWVLDMEKRFPQLKGRVVALAVPGGSEHATFRDPKTKEMLRQQVKSILGLP